MFVEGNVDFGNYFDHLMSWYSHRNEPNVMFITYEELKSNTRGSILKVAEFLGEQYVKKLKNDPEVLEIIVQKTNFENMKQLNMNKKEVQMEFASSKQPTEVAELVAQLKDPEIHVFVRKGCVGEWRNFFSEKQIERMKEIIAIKTKGSDFMHLWKDISLP